MMQKSPIQQKEDLTKLAQAVVLALREHTYTLWSFFPVQG